jgi:hypothetical protein
MPIETERMPSEEEWDDPENFVSSPRSSVGSSPPSVDVDLSREQVLVEMRALMATYLPSSRGRHLSEEDREKLVELGWLLAELEPDVALELLGDIKSRRQLGLVGYTLFKGLTQKDPQIARALYESIPSSRSHAGLRYTALSAICRTWAEDEPDEALQYALELESGRLRSVAMRQVARGWTKRDPMDALARADAGIEGDEASTEWLRRAMPEYVARELLARTKESDPWSTMTWMMENLPESVQKRMLPELVGRCAEASPEMAHELVDSMAVDQPDPAQLVSEVGPALAAWAKHDVQAVLGWLDVNLADDTHYVKGLQATFYQLNDFPGRQAEILTSAPLFYDDRTAGISMLTSYVMREGSRDPVATWEWIQSVRDKPDLQEIATRALGHVWTRQDYDAALAWGMNMDDNNNAKAFALSNVAAQQAQRRMDKSTDWIKELSGFTRARTSVGYTLGQLRVARDWNAVRQIKKMMEEDAYELSAVHAVINDAHVSDDVRNELLDIVQF